LARLLDLNVLIALAWPSHVHHAVAQTWFGRNRRQGWATYPMTQTGFLRISSNPKFIDGAVTPGEARSFCAGLQHLKIMNSGWTTLTCLAMIHCRYPVFWDTGRSRMPICWG
jgi:predicted nucleic acid-binding protein